eukprot:4951552-Heterocapsa_arctica.AAC.1
MAGMPLSERVRPRLGTDPSVLLLVAWMAAGGSLPWISEGEVLELGAAACAGPRAATPAVVCSRTSTRA